MDCVKELLCPFEPIGQCWLYCTGFWKLKVSEAFIGKAGVCIDSSRAISLACKFFLKEVAQ